MIVIINYGLGNLFSVLGAVEKLGFKAKISSKIKDMEKADKLILPGVGAFSDGMKNLHELGLVEPLTKLVVENKKPILGICLGCQLMAKESDEFGHNQGLGWIDGSVIRLETENKELRVPHVGWDELLQRKKSTLFEGIPEDALFYYTHSFHIKCKNVNDILGECDYGGLFTAAFCHNNIYGTQFHPEKSQLHGLNLLRNFLEKR
ncbi:imidazole glycerol phosphate synthase subunit HisH [Candidatus Woesearchaeota archaeon]|nr:imidazole glycerol phosphate synthase subunit HisH [Candidatus Woesearchaeota archaeon]